jgi:Zn finger protein HypA/HybF involved in hydrogenase expression
VEWCPAVQECATCGEVKQRVDRSWLPLCPDCGEVLKVTGGMDLEVVELTYETEDSGGKP